VLNLRGKSIQYNILMRDVDTDQALYNGLLQQYKNVGVVGAVGSNNISMVDAASVPNVPYTPNLMKNLWISLVLGLLAAIALVALVELLDDTFKTPEEVEEQLGLAVLGVIPYAKGDIFEQLRESPRAAISEAYRSLRTALQFSTDAGVPKSIFVTSARAGDGKSIVAMALAINLAQLGLRVLLIDADLRKTEQEGILGQETLAGLSNILAGAMEAGAVIKETNVPRLWLIGAGPVPPNPAELLAGPKMGSLLADAIERFDVTVLDGPPVMGLADAPLVASIVAGTIMVVSVGEGRRGAIRGALRRLHFARARLIGAVVNKFDSRKVAYRYGYGYGYGHGYGYGTYGYGYGGYGYGEVNYHGSKGKSISRQLRPTAESGPHVEHRPIA
jgi:polysaccharide biosynthesis transport protein